MQNRTNLGASLGSLLSGAFDPTLRMQGMRDAAAVEQARATIDFANARSQGQMLENDLLERQKALNPDDLALAELGITGSLGQQLKKWATTGDYGNGTMTVPNVMEDGMMNLANSSYEQPIKPTGWNDELANNFLKKRNVYNYGISMGEKNPENIQKAFGQSRENDFMAGAGTDPLQYGVRSAAVNGDPEKVQQVQFLQTLATQGATQQELEAAARGMILSNGGSMYDFSKDGVGNKVTGGYVANVTPAGGKGDEKDYVFDPSRGLTVNKITGEAKKVTVNGQPIGSETDDGIMDMGLPKPKVMPWQNVADPKQKAIMQSRVYSNDAKLLSDFDEEVAKAKSFADDADQFLNLNKEVGTGGAVDKTAMGRWFNSFNDKYATMESLSAKSAPNMRPAGSGATSDFDARQYQRATFGVDKPGNTNKAIAVARKAYAQNLSDYQEFRRDYLEQNGTLAGAENYWKQYVEKNPILDKSKPGTFTLNAKRQNWRQFFSGGQPAGAKPSAGAPAMPTKVVNGVTYVNDGKGWKVQR